MYDYMLCDSYNHHLISRLIPTWALWTPPFSTSYSNSTTPCQLTPLSDSTYYPLQPLFYSSPFCLTTWSTGLWFTHIILVVPMLFATGYALFHSHNYIIHMTMPLPQQSVPHSTFYHSMSLNVTHLQLLIVYDSSATHLLSTLQLLCTFTVGLHA